jgi:hypothetical protein
MQRVILLIILSVVAALAIVYGLRSTHKTSNAAVTSLLPRQTIALAHLPDLNRMRDEWHQSDIYQLYREPAMQDFLRKPLTRVQQTNAVTHVVQDMEKLDLKDGFMALTSVENQSAKMIGGFRFRGSPNEAEAVLGRWRNDLLGAGAKAQRQTLDYQQHKIDIVTAGANSVATVYDRDWFFGSNDVNELKALLDRADGRAGDRKSLLSADEAFSEAMAQMPASYSLLFYLQPKILAEKLAKLRAAVGHPPPADQRTLLEEIRSMCATTRFEGGKMHDVMFVGMPRQPQDGNLTRQSATLGSRDTFLYLASLINFSRQVALLDPSTGGNFLGGMLQKIGRAVAAAHIAPDDWKAAFGSEAGMLGDWPGDAHSPSLILTSAVKDATRARNIITVLTHAIDEDAYWKETDRDGVHYWAMQTGPTFIAIRPVVGMSSHVVVAGLDETSVDTAIRRSESSSSELSRSDTYKRAARSLPEPTNFFGYIDLALLYSRLDATLRPMLLMSAAFMPAINDYADPSKLPPPEVVTRHLSPIVSSQQYKGNGYVAESIGPITINESGIGIGLLAGKAALHYQRAGLGGVNPWNPQPRSSPQPAAPTPSPVPGSTP